MENIKQKIVLPTRGVCNTTPDPICEDNEMEDCVGLTYADDAIRPIQDVAKQIEVTDGTLKIVHRINDGENANYIIVKDDNTHFYFYGGAETYELPAAIIDVTSVGNTIIFNTEDGLYYYLWKNNGYEYIGNRIPEPKVDMIMKRSDGIEHQTAPYVLFPDSKLVVNYVNLFNVWDFNEDKFYGDTENEVKDNEKTMTDLILGAYAENKKIAAEDNRFVNPFLAVYAVELFDGTYTLISNPILMLPSVHENTMFLERRISEGFGMGLFVLTLNSALYFKQETDYSDWADIVRGVTIFVSDDIDLYHTDRLREYKFSNTHYSSDPSQPEGYFADMWCGVDGICGTKGGFEASYLRETGTRRIHGIGFHNNFFELGEDVHLQPVLEDELNLAGHLLGRREADQIIADISRTSNFYKVAEIGAKPITEMTSLVKYMPSKALATLTTRDRLDVVDFYSHCKIRAEKVYSFNRRLNVIGIDRGFFEGFKAFCPYRNNVDDYSVSSNRTQAYKVEVTITTSEGDTNISYTFNSDDIFFEKMWFFYPDPRAKHVKVSYLRNGTYVPIFEDDLIEHRGLNGAYRIGNDLPTGKENQYVIPDTVEKEVIEISPDKEHLPNYLLQSNVDNPFTFSASSYFRVGQGRILGIAGLTTALSQDAYKVATTIVFTTQGIWALEIDSEGVYKTVQPPFSREVCSNPKSITMVDNGIYYVSKRGLMVISDNANGCVTTQICGKSHKEYDSFTEFIQNCTCAYDYRDSQLWLINPDYDFHWVYSIKSGTLSRKEDGHSYEAVVSDYPDTLLQAEGSIFSMYQEPNINDDETLYSGFFITRPMKFEQAMALKSLRDLKHIKDMNEDAEITLTIFASNDCNTWQQLPSLKGRGFKYFKFRYDLTNLKAADAFCGTVLYYTTRETDRIR